MANRDSGTRQDTFLITVNLQGNSFGVWDKKTGGEVDSDEVKYYPGGMALAQSLGGRVNTGNITLQRLYDLQDDHDRIQTLINAIGKGKCKVSQRPMDFNTAKGYGKTITWTGVLKRVLVPDVDSESTSAAMIEIEVTVATPPIAA